MMRKSIIMLLVAVLLMGSVQRVNAQELPTLTVVDHIQVDDVGKTFNVTVELTVPAGVSIINLKGFQVKLGYNTTILDCLNVELLPGHPFEGLNYQFSKAIEDGNGYAVGMCITIEATACVNVTESKPLFKYTFKSTGLGASALTFLNVNQTGGTYLIDVNGVKIPVSVSDGTVEIVNEFPSIWLTTTFMSIVMAVHAVIKYKKGRN